MLAHEIACLLFYTSTCGTCVLLVWCLYCDMAGDMTCKGSAIHTACELRVLTGSIGGAASSGSGEVIGLLITQRVTDLAVWCHVGLSQCNELGALASITLSS